VKTERLRLLIAYDGRAFRGWQSQAGGGAVQDHLERALARLCGGRIVVHGSGRTDAGVHALGQVAHADVPRGKFDLRTWQLALNANLPPEVRVLRVNRAAAGFHARFDARGKIYDYRLWLGSALHPLEIGRAWHVPLPIDFERLRAGARLITGRHDFAAFAANRGKPEKDTVRTIHSVRVTRRGPLVTLRFEGDGFLYRMVRLLTGSLMRVAQGKAPLDWLRALLAGKGAMKSNFAAPPDGLYLVRVLY
jgi:tRNA pseudouridine38-40 synthase